MKKMLIYCSVIIERWIHVGINVLVHLYIRASAIIGIEYIGIE